ncbi:MAG: hypothetical protein Q9163_005092 [Psora crenata]
MVAEANGAEYIEDEGISVSLTHKPLDVSAVLASVKSPKAGATVLFAGLVSSVAFYDRKPTMTRTGTTRDNFGGKPVTQLQYTAYIPRALQSMLSIAKDVKTKHSLIAICITHRLGVCPIGEESILIAVSAPHRQAAWQGGEDALEQCKEKVEVWKMEEFGGDEVGIWRANRDGAAGIQVD